MQKPLPQYGEKLARPSLGRITTLHMADFLAIRRACDLPTFAAAADTEGEILVRRRQPVVFHVCQRKGASGTQRDKFFFEIAWGLFKIAPL